MNYAQNFLNYVGQKYPISFKFMDEMVVTLSDGQNVYGHSLKGTPCIEMTRHNSHRNVTASVIVDMSGVKYVKIPTELNIHSSLPKQLKVKLMKGNLSSILAYNAPIQHNMADRELNNYLSRTF